MYNTLHPVYTQVSQLTWQLNCSYTFIGKETAPSKDPTLYVTLHTIRLVNGTQLAAELVYTELNVWYASIRVSGRVRGAIGEVAGIFTYYNDTTESDVEILTRDPSTQVHFSNRPTTDPFTENPIARSKTLPTGRITPAWNVYRFDWIRGYTQGM
jgi:hypothetical protein